MSENMKEDQKATIVSSVERVSVVLYKIEKELGLRGNEPAVIEAGTVSSDKVNEVIHTLDSTTERLNDVLASVSGIG